MSWAKLYRPCRWMEARMRYMAGGLLAFGLAAIGLGLVVTRVSVSAFHEIVAAACIGFGGVWIGLGGIMGLLIEARDRDRAREVRRRLDAGEPPRR